ncbi:hypothetical protein SAMN02949497_3424 [Methylomagnum ishizawai]|uniref:Uncharacterized protein n=1 Tax=Methylomagnum ishizawai TaxID=1760988 RepID=A0A1Y6D6R8_9GAMM|nr:hypothetical protein [Methylomagnum ishizawai]SMF96044.1 hypothetical protein SAMN02949497_3424 [Methylomagnum ishizawai]
MAKQVFFLKDSHYGLSDYRKGDAVWLSDSDAEGLIGMGVAALCPGTAHIATAGTVTSTPAVVDVSGSPGPVTVTVIPGAGNTSKAEYSTTPDAATNPGAANWQAWPPGTISAIATDVFLGRLAALRFTRVTGSATDTYEVLA